MIGRGEAAARSGRTPAAPLSAGGQQPLPGLGSARGQPAENPRHFGAGDSRHVGRHLVQMQQGENCGRGKRQGVGLNASP